MITIIIPWTAATVGKKPLFIFYAENGKNEAEKRKKVKKNIKTKNATAFGLTLIK